MKSRSDYPEDEPLHRIFLNVFLAGLSFLAGMVYQGNNTVGNNERLYIYYFALAFLLALCGLEVSKWFRGPSLKKDTLSVQ